MGIGDWLEDKANQVGSAVENAVESASATVGEAVDDVLDVGADGARALGLDSIGEGLDDLGDQVSSALGGQVEERELGETEDPKELIRGEPPAITESATSLGKLSTAADQTADGLRSVGNVGDWTGLGADGFEVGFTPQPTKWTEAADAFTDAKAALEAWAAAVTAAQGLAADAIAEWKAGVAEQRRVLARWRALSDEQKASTTVIDTWTPRFQAARDILGRARTNRDTAAAQATTAIATATQLAPQEPPFVSRMGANLEDAWDIGNYAQLSFTDGLLTGLTGIVQFVRQVNPTDTYNLTHPGQYLENMSNLAGNLVVTAADPGPVVDAFVDNARKNPFEAMGQLSADLLTSIPTGGAGLAVKAPSLINKIDNLAPNGHGPSPGTHSPAPTRATPEPRDTAPVRDTPEPRETAPDSNGPANTPHADTDTGAPHQGTPRTDAPEQGPSAAPDSSTPETNVQAGHHDQPAPAREQPAARDTTDDVGGVEAPGTQLHSSPEAPAARPDTTTPESPAPRTENPSPEPVRADEPSTPPTRGDQNPPDPDRDTYTPPTRPEADTPATRPDTDTPASRADTDTPATRPDTDTPASRADTDTPATRPDTDTPATRPDTDTPAEKPSPNSTFDNPNSGAPKTDSPTTAREPDAPRNPDSAPDAKPAANSRVDSDNHSSPENTTTPTRSDGDAAPRDTTQPTPVHTGNTPNAGAGARAPESPGTRQPDATNPRGPERTSTPENRPKDPDGQSPGPKHSDVDSRPEPAGPRPHPDDATTPRTNLDAGNTTRPHPESPDAPRHDTTPDTRPEPDQRPTPDRDPAGRDPDSRGDHDETPTRDNDSEPDHDREGDNREDDSDSPADSTDDVADAAKEPANTQTDTDVAKCGDPVDAATGEFLLPETDLALPGVLPLVLTRRHRSNYRWGRWFGPTWSSTLDMRVVVDEDQVTFVGEDGLLLAYPHAEPGIAVEPLVGGVRYTCARTDTGTYRVADPEREIVWHFAPEPGLDARFGVYGIAAITDRHRNRIRFHYNDDGAPTAITHTGGYRIEITTDPAIGRVIGLAVVDTTYDTAASLSEGDGRTSGDRETRTAIRRFDYAACNLVAVTNGDRGTTHYTYDDRDRMLSWTDSRGTSMVNTYDSAGRVILQHGTDGILNAGFEYLEYPDGSGRLTRHINSQGAVTTRGFDEDLRVRDLMDPLGAHTRIDYNPDRRPLRVTAPDNTITSYSYTPDGDVARIVRPDGLAIDIDYAWRNRPATITHPDSTTEHRDWDGNGNLTATTDPGGIRTEYSYHTNGAIASIIEPNTARTSITVNAAGLPVAVTDPLGATTHIRRDGFGRPTTVTDPLGHTTRYQWSPEGKLLRRLDPDGHHESWTYDGEGNLLTHTNRAGGVTRFAYGSWDLLVARTEPDGSTTRYAYDTERRLTAVTNPLGHTWHYHYDAAGRLTSETDYNGSTTTYTHDVTGKVATVTPATGVTRRHRYDLLGRLTEITTDTGHWRRYTHDPLGRPLTATTGEAETPIHSLDFTYTPGGQLLTQTLDAGTPMRFAYDPLGRRELRTTPTGAETRWRWDWCGRPTALDTDGHTIGFAHDPAGQLTEWTIGELAITRTHDPVGRLQRQTVTGFPTRLSTLGLDTASRPNPRQLRTDEYAWRPDGYITNHTTHTDQTTTHRDYQLDPIGRVESLARNGVLAEKYTYDPLSNITHSYTPGAPTTATLDTAPPPVETTDNGHREYHRNLLIRDGRTRYHYDQSGRLIRKTTTRLSRKPDAWHYRYDAFDQLTDVWTPDHQWWHYTYDALGRRTTKQHLAADGTVLERTAYTWDGTHLIEQTEGDISTRWHYQPSTHNPLTQSTSQEMIDRKFYAVIVNLVGSPTALIDVSSVSAEAASAATIWGNASWLGTMDTVLRFAGQQYDRESGLNYNLHRFYDSATGRFLTPDLLGLSPAPNPVTYPHNPTVWNDPLGLAPDECRKPTYGNGGHIDNISPSEAQRIQNAANLRGVEIHLVGSRASGTAGPWSDWDYSIPDANSRMRSRIKGSLPQGSPELGYGRRIDIFTHPPTEGLPYITFYPNKVG
ncbi:putative T7SS-secreted protein [Nocardia sp. NPDC050406]|uniref:putative T7SS-secreted protein n=1 Tax=Nocardia sp. NPDC050406 TaxID=3364318 RepID=UPI0037895CB8